MLDFSCFVPPSQVLHCSKISLDFGQESLKLLALGDRGRVIQPLYVRIVLGMYSFFDLFVILIEPVFMGSGLHSEDFLCSLIDCFFERGQFLSAAFGGYTILELLVKHLLESCPVGWVLQPGDIVVGPGSLGSVSAERCNVQRQQSPVVSPVLSTLYGTGNTDVPEVSLTDDNEVYQVPVFRPRVHLGDLVLVCHSEQGVSNTEAMLCTLAEEEQTVVIDLAYSVSAQNTFPAALVPSHPRIKVSNDD